MCYKLSYPNRYGPAKSKLPAAKMDHETDHAIRPPDNESETMTPIDAITVHRALPEDCRMLSALGRETFADSFGADNYPQDMADYLQQSFSPKIQALEMAEPSSCFLIARAGRQPVGYSRLVEAPAPACINAPRPIKIERFYAHKQWIGCGVGAALMRACIAEANARACDAIWLGVWEKNDRAIRFYRRWGFSKKGTQTFVLGHDHQTDWLLWLPLGATMKKGYQLE